MADRSARTRRLAVVCAALLCRGSAVAAQLPSGEADRLYADRTNLSNARRAAQLWTGALARDPKDFEAAWKLARADYWLGDHLPENERDGALEDGAARARVAILLQPDRPEGHFWLAADLGALGERSKTAGLRYRRTIKEELETVLRLDAAYLDGSADRALGRWYARVPRLFGGNRTLAEQHLRASLKYNPASTVSHFFLGELLLDEGRRMEARGELQAVIDAPRDRDWDPEDQEFKAKARALLESVR